jgi:hypothetical protein
MISPLRFAEKCFEINSLAIFIQSTKNLLPNLKPKE